MQNVLNTLRVLEDVAIRQPVGVSELARALEMPKSTVQRSLRTLHTAGWIRPVGTEFTRWALTTKVLHISRHAAGELSLRDVAIPVMEELRRATQETIHLMVPEGDTMVLIERLETPKPVRIVIPLGGSVPLLASSNGKAVLAFRPADEAALFLDEGLPRYTETTVVDRERLVAELAETRARGYAVNNGEWRSDIAAVAAAIVGDDDRPVAGISISTPINRMPDDLRPEYGALVRDAARRISRDLGRS